MITLGWPAFIEALGGAVFLGATIGVFACMVVCVKPNRRK